MTTNRTKGGAGVPNPGISPTAHVTWEKILAMRMQRHHLTTRATPEQWRDIVSDICGLHAQLMSSAKLSLSARINNFDHSTIEDALWEDQTLVKTWAVRGTLHLLPTNEYPLWQVFIDLPRDYEKKSWLNHFGFTKETFEMVLSAISEALDGEQLTREGLANEVARITGSNDFGERLKGSWGATLKPAAFQGRLCYGPDDGQHVRFVRPDQWIGDWDPVDPDQAITAITKRYIAAYGPITRGQYARWAGITHAEAGRRIEQLGDDVCIVEIEEGPLAWMMTEDVNHITSVEPTGSIRLLPRFDPYVVGGPRDEPAVLSSNHTDDVFRSNGWISAVMVVSGRIEGVWEYDSSDERVGITIEPFSALEPEVRQKAEIEAETIANSLGVDLSYVNFQI